MRFLPPSVRAGIAAIVLLGTLVDSGQAAAPPATSRRLPTPALIERAVGNRTIERDTGYLYLAYALGRPHKLPQAYRSEAFWEGTLPLLTLKRASRGIAPGPERTAIMDIISGQSGPGWCGLSGSSLPNSTTTPHFYVEYGAIGGGLTLSSYTTSLESSWATEVGAFGWAAPPVWPSNPPPENKYHVRVDSLGPGLYGYVANGGAHTGLVGNNPATAWDEGDAYASCMVLRNDYSGFPSPPQASLDATTAHEFNHAIQFGYGALHGANRPDSVFIEGGTTAIEDEVFDASNDSYNYLWPTFEESLGDFDASPYGAWIIFRALTEQYGTGMVDGSEQILQDFWEETSRNTGDNLTALETALAKRGTNLADAYHAHAIAAKFNKGCGGEYPHPYCLEEGPEYVVAKGATSPHGTVSTVGGSFSGSIEENYALNWVALPGSGSTYDLTLSNMSTVGQLRGSVVCDTGSSLLIYGFPSVVGPASSSRVGRFNATGCSNAVAVITNQAQTAPNPPTSVPSSYQLSTSTASTDATLSATRVGSGSGTVSSDAAGITCGADCAENYSMGSVINLTATPATGSVFAGWSGACTGMGFCSVTLDSAKPVTASFTALFPASVTKSGSGAGTVTSDVPGINCGPDCSETYSFGTEVGLRATPAPGSAFTGWSGAGCSGSLACRIRMNWTKHVEANFTADTAPAPPVIGGSDLSQPFQKSGKFVLTWETDPATGGGRFDVRFRSAPYGGDFGDFVPWRTGTTDTSGAFEAEPGRTYCFSARVTNAALKTSEFGDERCTAVPVDNPSLRHRGPWAKKRGSGYFLGTFSMTSASGSSVVLSGVRAKRLAVVVTKCRRCGTIKVFFGRKLLRTVRLAASGVKKMRVVNIATFDTVRVGRLRAVVATSGRPVKIEGVGASRV